MNHNLQPGDAYVHFKCRFCNRLSQNINNSVPCWKSLAKCFCCLIWISGIVIPEVLKICSWNTKLLGTMVWAETPVNSVIIVLWKIMLSCWKLGTKNFNLALSSQLYFKNFIMIWTRKVNDKSVYVEELRWCILNVTRDCVLKNTVLKYRKEKLGSTSHCWVKQISCRKNSKWLCN